MIVVDPNFRIEAEYTLTDDVKPISETNQRIYTIKNETMWKGTTSTEALWRFLQRGSDVNVVVLDRLTPLTVAIALNDRDAINELLAKGADVNMVVNGINPSLYAAVKFGNLEILRLLKENNLNIDSMLNPIPNHGSVLHLAATEGHLPVMRELVSWGFNINEQDHLGNTPLHYLANSKPEAIKEFVALGGDLSICNKEEFTPGDKPLSGFRGLLICMMTAIGIVGIVALFGSIGARR